MTLRPSPVDAPDAHDLLAEYFRVRTEGFADQGVEYRTTFPDPAAFVPPSGVFVVLDDDEGVAQGCGGIRLLPDGPLGTRYELKHLYLRPVTRGRGWGRLLVEDIGKQMQWWVAHGFMKRAIPLRDIVDTGFVEAAVKALPE